MVERGFRDLAEEGREAGENQQWPNDESKRCEGNGFGEKTYIDTERSTGSDQVGPLNTEDGVKERKNKLSGVHCGVSIATGHTLTTHADTVEGQDKLEEETSRASLTGRSISTPSGFRGKGICRCVPARHVLAVMAFLGCVNLFTLRVNLSVALVAMVKHVSSVNRSHSKDECDFIANSSSQDQEAMSGEFEWGAQLQGHVLGSFFYGYLVTQVLGGWLAGKIGGKRVFGASVLATSILSLLTPTAASFHVSALIVVRVLQGMAQGFAFPSIHAIWSKWAPVRERSRLLAFSYAGAQMGTVLAMPVTGILCKQPFTGGWPAAFYVFGGLGVVWCIAWAVLVHDSPSLHPRISHRERNYILDSSGARQHNFRPPWRAMFSTPAVWAIVGAHFAYDWGCFTTLTMLPQFMYQVLRFDITQNGGLSALPYLVLWFTNTISGPVADCLRNHHLSTKVTRKIMNSLGLLVPAVLILGVGYVGCDPILVVTLLTLGVGMSGFTLSGYNVNVIDIAPKFAGILMGISNSFGTTAGFIGPVVVGALTIDDPSLKQWRVFFLITAAIYSFGGVIFLIFSEGEETEWSKRSGDVSKTMNCQKPLYIPPCDISDSKPECSR